MGDGLYDWPLSLKDLKNMRKSKKQKYGVETVPTEITPTAEALTEAFTRGTAKAIEATRAAGLPVYVMEDGIVKAIPNHDFKGKRFYLERKEDVSGLSGTGIVAEGIEFINGLVAMSWLSAHPGINIYPSIRQIEELHGHQGRTVVVWIDK